MIEAYKIGTTFVLNDLVTSKLIELSKQFFKLEQQSVSLNKAFKHLGGEQSGIRVAANAARALDANLARAQMQAANLTRRLEGLKATGLLSDKTKALHGEFAKAEASAAKLGASLSFISEEAAGIEAVAASARALSRYLGQAGGRASNLHKELARIKEMGALPQMPNLPSRYHATLYPRGGRRGHEVGGVPLHGGDIHVGANGVGMAGVGVGVADMMGGPAMAGLAAAYGAYAMSKAAVSEAGTFDREQRQFEMFGMSAAQNAEAMRFVRQTKMPGASLIDKLRFVTEAQGVFRESGMSGAAALEGAERVAPILAKLHYASLLTGREMSEANEKSMLRFVESSGGLASPAELNRIADMGFKVTMTSGGNVDWEQLRQAARTGGIAFKGLSDEARFAWGEPLIGEMKGMTFGQGLMTAFNRMNGLIRLPNQSYHEMERLGLWDQSMVVENRMGGIKRLLGNPLKHSDEYAANPFKYYVDYIKPKYDALKLTTAQRDRENALIFGNTGSRLFSTLEQQLATIQRSLPALTQAKGLNTGVQKTDATLAGNMREFSAAWSDFKTEFGKSELPMFIDMLRAGTALLRRIGRAEGDLSAEQKYANEAHGFWDRAKRVFDWEVLGKHPGAPVPDKTIATPHSQPLKADITILMDGKEVGRHVTSVVLKPMRTGAPLGIGTFDPGIGMLSSHNGY